MKFLENYFFRKKLCYFKREPFLTRFYTLNSSLLLINKLVFKLKIILSNYQWCPLPLQYKNLTLKPVHTSWECEANFDITRLFS